MITNCLRYVVLVFIIWMSGIIHAQLAINIYNDTSVCENATVKLGGFPTVTGGSGDYSFLWTPDTLLDDNTVANPVALCKSEIEYHLLVTDNISGDTISGKTKINVIMLPVVKAGGDQTVCIESNIVNISLYGDIAGYTSTGKWQTTGDGYFPPGDSLLNTSYTLGANDKWSHSFDILLISTHNNLCEAVSDTLTVFVEEPVIVNAGEDITVCNYNTDISLSGSVTGGTTSGIWSADSDGSFFPSDEDLKAIYQATNADTVKKEFFLTLTSTYNRGCKPVSDSVKVSFIKKPTVYAGQDISAKSRIVNLNGTVSSGLKIKWITNGSGYFFPSDSVLQTKYYMTSYEVLNENIIDFILAVNEPLQCMPDADTLTVMNPGNKIPNAFSPDNDGTNDLFMQGEKLKVFNRWGHLIYDGSDGWDGKYKGEPVSSGTYFYIIEYQSDNVNPETYRGTVTLVLND